MLQRIGANYSVQMWNMVLTFADRIILVGIMLRVWGETVYADWATLFASANLLFMAELGLNIYFGNKWQHAFAHKDEVAFKRYISISLTIYLFLGLFLVTSTLGYILTAHLDEQFGLRKITSGEALQIFLLLAIANILCVTRGSISQIYRGRNEFARGVFITSMIPLGKVVVCGILVWTGFPPVVIAGAYALIEFVVGWGLTLFDIKRHFPTLSLSLSFPTRSEITDIGHKVFWYGLLQGVPVAWLHLPVLIFAAMGIASIVLVSFLVTRTLINFSRMIIELLARSVAVEIAPSFHLGDQELIRRSIITLGRFLAAITSSMAGGLIIFAAPLLLLWTGNKDLYHLWTLLWLLLPVIAIAPAIPLSNTFHFGNMPRQPALASLLQLTIGLILCYALVQSHGITGGVAGLAIGEILGLGMLLPLLARRKLPLSYRSYYIHCIIITAIAGFWSLLIASALQKLIGFDRIELFVISGILWGLLGFLPPLILSLPYDIRKRLFHLIRRYAGAPWT